MKEIGEIYFMSDAVPPPSGDVSVRLAAGKALSGGYNVGKIASETVSGYYPNVSAVAVISDAASPLDGQQIRLIETEGFSLSSASAYTRIS